MQNNLYWEDEKEFVANDMTFVRTEILPTSEMTAEDCLGTWACGRCSITISEETEGIGYLVSVHWSSSAATAEEWTYRHCIFSVNESGAHFICTGNASCTGVTYSETGETSAVVNYIEGNGSFTIANDILTWNDEVENSGADMEFIKVKENVDFNADAKDFFGTWTCGRCAVTISEETEGIGYLVSVHWSSSAATAEEWTYRHCIFSVNESGAHFICTGNASCTGVTYSETGETSAVVNYIEGNGSFTIANDILTWNDEVENSGADMEFIKVEISYASGDADGNGKINILDVITLNKAVMGKENLTASQLKAIDFNGNSQPDSEESLLLLKYIVGLVTSFTA